MANLSGIKLLTTLSGLLLFGFLMWQTIGLLSGNLFACDDFNSALLRRSGDGSAPNSADARLLSSVAARQRVDLRVKLRRLVERRAKARDPELISLVRQLMDRPSRHGIKPAMKIVQTPQSIQVSRLLGDMKRGFFVEAGALDGERSSNTLFLEQRRGWTGLLIEMDPYYYTQLMGKSRRCWSINACISPYDHAVQSSSASRYSMVFISFPNCRGLHSLLNFRGLHSLLTYHQDALYKFWHANMEFKEASGATGKLVKDTEQPEAVRKGVDSEKVPCFPLETMLLALNQTHVDYFSLDVEGFELEVLQTIPFDKLDISVLSVEYIHGERSKQEYAKFMSEKGYRVHRDIHLHKPDIALYVDDFIFVKNDLHKQRTSISRGQN